MDPLWNVKVFQNGISYMWIHVINLLYTLTRNMSIVSPIISAKWYILQIRLYWNDEVQIFLLYVIMPRQSTGSCAWSLLVHYPTNLAVPVTKTSPYRIVRTFFGHFPSLLVLVLGTRCSYNVFLRPISQMTANAACYRSLLALIPSWFGCDLLLLFLSGAFLFPRGTDFDNMKPWPWDVFQLHTFQYLSLHACCISNRLIRVDRNKHMDYRPPL